MGWRFTDHRYDPPLAEALAAIAPLNAASAGVVFDWLRDSGLHDGFPFQPGLFRRAATVDLAKLEGVKVVESLHALGPEMSEDVVLSWDEETAVIATWGTVVRWWNTFFYPSSDDLTVIGPSGEWAVLFHHEGFAYFGSNRAG